MPACASRAHQGCGSLPEPSALIIAAVNQRFQTVRTRKDKPRRPVSSKKRWGTLGERGGRSAPHWQAEGPPPGSRLRSLHLPAAGGFLGAVPPRQCPRRRMGALLSGGPSSFLGGRCARGSVQSAAGLNAETTRALCPRAHCGGACNLIHPQGPGRAPPAACAQLPLSCGGRSGPRPGPSKGEPITGQTSPLALGLKGQRSKVSALDELREWGRRALGER